MENLNIIQLIEKNPVTRLSKNYENKFISKIQEKFTEAQQNIFVGSLFGYLNYNSKTDFVIDFDSIWKWLGYSRKDPAKVVLQKHFTINIDYKIVLRQPAENPNTNKSCEEKASPYVDGAKNITNNLHGNIEHRGGLNKETILLNISTFKKLCLKSNTKKADEIHDYFITLEETLQEIINQESDELKLQLQENNNAMMIKDNNIAKLHLEKISEKHNILLREFGFIGSIVYIIRIKSYLSGEYVIKIGESRRGIQDRYTEHKSNYDEAVILDCFTVNNSKDFETFLHNHEDIKSSRVFNLAGHENERELFTIGNVLTYPKLLNIINNNKKHFKNYNEQSNKNEIEKYKLEIQRLKLLNTKVVTVENLDLAFITENFNKLFNKIDKLQSEVIELKNVITHKELKTTNNFNETLVNLGPRLQKINPDTLLLVKVYESVTECIKENNLIKRPSINKAIVENTIYQNFRWKLVDREIDPNILVNIEKTKVTRVQNIGYIAKLNINKNKILNIYLDRKSAAKANNINVLDNIVKKCSLANGSYYVLYDELSTEIKNKYQIPILYKNGIGKFDINDILLKEFIYKEDARIKEMISTKTLTKALESGKLYNNFYYKFIGEKLSC